MNKIIGIKFTAGSGGNFLRHFIDPDITKNNAQYFTDKDWFGKETHPYKEDRFVLSFLGLSEPRESDWKIGLGPTNLKEYIRVRTMVNTKNMQKSIEQIDEIVIDFHNNDVEYFDYNCDYMLPYTKLFDWKTLTSLYNLINNTDPPLDKQKYFNSYKEKHDKIFSCWHYKVIEKICIFEYNNITTQKRNWSIDDITKDNWQTFLQENLCLTSYH